MPSVLHFLHPVERGFLLAVRRPEQSAVVDIGMRIYKIKPVCHFDAGIGVGKREDALHPICLQFLVPRTVPRVWLFRETDFARLHGSLRRLARAPNYREAEC